MARYDLLTIYSHQSNRYSVVCTGNIWLMRLDIYEVEIEDESKSWAFVIHFMVMLGGHMAGAFWIYSVFGLRYTGYTGLDWFGSFASY